MPPGVPPPPEPLDCGQPCPMCGSREQPVYVHGHSQCATCKVNIDPCCGGAPLADETA